MELENNSIDQETVSPAPLTKETYDKAIAQFKLTQYEHVFKEINPLVSDEMKVLLATFYTDNNDDFIATMLKVNQSRTQQKKNIGVN